jgi:hypothetical protein
MPDPGGKKRARLSMMSQKINGLVVYSQNVRTLYLIQKVMVRLKCEIRNEKMGEALHDVTEIEGDSDERRKSCKNLSY